MVFDTSENSVHEANCMEPKSRTFSNNSWKALGHRSIINVYDESTATAIVFS